MNAANTPKTAIVTGGSSGIGLAIAKRLAGNGYQVTIVARNAERLQQAADDIGHGVAWLVADVSDLEQVEDVLVANVRKLERIDVLVNNAGGTHAVNSGMPLAQAALAWDEVLKGNLRSTFLVSMAVLPHLVAPGGRIINLSSIAAQNGSSRPGGLAYAAAKAGVQGFTLSLARELGPHGITVNAVAPGFIAETRFFGAGAPAERVNEIIGETPVGRVGAPDDIAATVAWLASPEASFVTGTTISVNGGWRVG